jgi:hypothetical protein
MKSHSIKESVDLAKERLIRLRRKKQRADQKQSKEFLQDAEQENLEEELTFLAHSPALGLTSDFGKIAFVSGPETFGAYLVKAYQIYNAATDVVLSEIEMEQTLQLAASQLACDQTRDFKGGYESCRRQLLKDLRLEWDGCIKESAIGQLGMRCDQNELKNLIVFLSRLCHGRSLRSRRRNVTIDLQAVEIAIESPQTWRTLEELHNLISSIDTIECRRAAAFLVNYFIRKGENGEFWVNSRDEAREVWLRTKNLKETYDQCDRSGKLRKKIDHRFRKFIHTAVAAIRIAIKEINKKSSFSVRDFMAFECSHEKLANSGPQSEASDSQ